MLLGYGGLQAIDGSLSIGTLVAFQMLATGFAAPVAQLVGFGAVLQQASGNLASVDDVLNYDPDPESLPRPRVDRLGPALGRHHRGVYGGADLLDQRPDVLGGPADAVRELANFVGHDAEPPPGVPRAGGFD